jgi:FtsP/CotA-like multicopper oxidase with cupredoxin domain
MYHCHQEADIHVQMGMYGALVVYGRRDLQAAVGPNALLGGGTQMGFKYTRDTIMLLTEVDVAQHVSEEFANDPLSAPSGVGLPGVNPNTGEYPMPFNPVDYHPQYWLINGLSFPNTVHAGTPAGAATWAAWIAAHPGYDPLVTGSVLALSKPLVRMINLGFETQPMHVHGFHPKLIGMDQRAWSWSNPANAKTGTGLELNTFTIGSGNTMELLLDFKSQRPTSTYPLGTYSRYDSTPGPTFGLPALNTAIPITTFLPIPDVFSGPGIDFVGGPALAGMPAIALLAGQVFVWHNHDDYKATNNGVYPGGQFTAVIVNP